MRRANVPRDSSRPGPKRLLLPLRSFASPSRVARARLRRQFIGKPADYGQKVRDHYTTYDYHKPSDIVRPDWDMSGAREDLQVLFAVGYRVAEADKYPEWKPGNEFRAVREAQLKEKP
jgi:hypothetical protein